MVWRTISRKYVAVPTLCDSAAVRYRVRSTGRALSESHTARLIAPASARRDRTRLRLWRAFSLGSPARIGAYVPGALTCPAISAACSIFNSEGSHPKKLLAADFMPKLLLLNSTVFRYMATISGLV